MYLYGKKYKLVFSERDHKYLVNGEAKAGVTSILSILNKPGLPQWAANMVCEAIREGSEPFPHASGVAHYLVSENLLRTARNAFNSRRDNSANIGKDVHAWIENHINIKLSGSGEEKEYNSDMEPSIKSFLKWEEEQKPEYIFSERIIYSEDGDYCGTSDTGVKINGKYLILDFKTGKPEKEYNKRLRRYTGKRRAYNTVFLQDALYDLAIYEEEGIKADQYGALYLSTNGEILYTTTDATEDFREAGKSIVKVHKLLNRVNYLNQFK